jgi:hypothetical protein
MEPLTLKSKERVLWKLFQAGSMFQPSARVVGGMVKVAHRGRAGKRAEICFLRQEYYPGSQARLVVLTPFLRLIHRKIQKLPARINIKLP